MSRHIQETRVVGNIPVGLQIADNQRFMFISKDQRALTHGIHKYPAKFFPELPRWIIEKYSEVGDLVLDPFMGSGTTNLEASLLGRNSIGVDIDPFSRFISSVKTTPLNKSKLEKAYRSLNSIMDDYSSEKLVNGIPIFPYRDNWFKPYILRELAYINSSIESLNHTRRIKDFFLVCFSSIIRSVSEADNNCTRTVIRKKLNKQVDEGDAISLFVKRMKANVDGMIGLIDACPSGKVTIPKNADARNLKGISSNSIDLAVTSPPYMNAVDYPRTHQLELYWLGFANGSLQPLKRKHVGTEVVTASEYKVIHKTLSELADHEIEKIFKSDPRRACIASRYVNDMAQNLKEVNRVLKVGKKYVIVVGNNLVRGVQFESWKYLEEIAPRLGFQVDRHFVSGIINHFIKVPRAERINDDHVLVLRKCE